MRYVQIVFSPTGGTLKAAKTVTEELNGSVHAIAAAAEHLIVRRGELFV